MGYFNDYFAIAGADTALACSSDVAGWMDSGPHSPASRTATPMVVSGMNRVPCGVATRQVHLTVARKSMVLMLIV